MINKWPHVHVTYLHNISPVLKMIHINSIIVHSNNILNGIKFNDVNSLYVMGNVVYI